MIIFEMRSGGLFMRRGALLGQETEHTVFILSLIIFRITVIPKAASLIVRRATEALMNNPESLRMDNESHTIDLKLGLEEDE